jgi:hypothetical protein
MSAERRFLDSHSYEIKNLWKIAENNPIIDIPHKALNISHEKRHWTCRLGRPISAFEVFKNPALAPEDAKKVDNANLEYPIILAASNLDILDGLHRLNKSMKLGRSDIKAQLVSVGDLKRSERLLHQLK